MHKFVVPALLVLGFPGAALAQTPANFTALDADASGDLTFAELVVGWPDLTREEFDGADIDGNGALTMEELAALQPSASGSAEGAMGIQAVPAAPTGG